MTKLEKDTVIDAIITIYNMAKTDQEFREAVEKFKNEKVTISPTQELINGK